jgi:Asp-tRNA(Asn)/Glu-tRNA(Gln) amidotransferase A subunit family amidase
LSLQIIGASGEDRRTLAVAAACETIFGKPPMPPGFD